MRIGIDVGGTHTDAVLIDNKGVLIASCKVSTSKNVFDGIRNALVKILNYGHVDNADIQAVMLGTTHCVNAILQRKGLNKVGIIRISAPASTAVPPLAAWPEDLIQAIGGQSAIIHGGYEFNGAPIATFNEEEAREAILRLALDVDSFAVVGAFSVVNNDQEILVGKMIHDLTGKPYTLSHNIGSLGLLERENATILNMALETVARKTIESLKQVMVKEGLEHVSMYFCQNDGTVMDLDYALEHPILSIACGPTNSIRGAGLLTNQQRAIIIDIGGTSTDIGMIIEGFPQESTIPKNIGGCRTNFRMPDLVSIALGGGSVVREKDNHITVGPDSVAFQLTEKAFVFGGDTLTTTDIAVRLGMADIGDSSKVAHIDINFAKKVMNKISQMLIESIEQIKPSSKPENIIFVGGGSVLVNTEDLSILGNITIPENFGVANAIGAVSADAGGEIEKIYSYDELPRDKVLQIALQDAVALAIQSGAIADTIKPIFREEIPIAYLPGNAVKVKLKVIGTLKI